MGVGLAQQGPCASGLKLGSRAAAGEVLGGHFLLLQMAFRAFLSIVSRMSVSVVTCLIHPGTVCAVHIQMARVRF